MLRHIRAGTHHSYLLTVAASHGRRRLWALTGCDQTAGRKAETDIDSLGPQQRADRAEAGVSSAQIMRDHLARPIGAPAGQEQL